MSVHALLLLSCVHSLGSELDLGNSLDRREQMSAHTQITELPKIKRQLILNDTRVGRYNVAVVHQKIHQKPCFE